MRPRLGFLGVGWIGRNRLTAIAADGRADVVAVADADEMLAAEVGASVGAAVVPPAELLRADRLDGIVIATPSALHADQTIAALGHGAAVFCQKPLGRTAAETEAVVDVARAADRLLGVDLSYRHVAGVADMRRLIADGAIGEVYAASLTFHNAYGPDKAWFKDPALSGGGCLIDLGIHLVDLAQWMLDNPKCDAVTSRLYADGRRLGDDPAVVEDYAVAQLDLANGATINLACSWNLHAGRDAEIGAAFYGTHGAVALDNVGGSFYDFEVSLARGTSRQLISVPPDDWGGRAALAWVDALSRDPHFDRSAGELVDVAVLLDRMYGR